jgi:O-antigen ligase
MPSSLLSVQIGLLPLLLIGCLLCVPPAAGFSERQLPGSCLTGAMTRLMGELQTSTIRVSS